MAAVNAAVTHRLPVEQVLRGRRFRIDSTVTDAYIHHPTDAGLLADGIRRRTRVACQVPGALPVPGLRVRDRAWLPKRRILAIGKLLRRRRATWSPRCARSPKNWPNLGRPNSGPCAAWRQAQQRLTAAQEPLTPVIVQSRVATAG